MATPNKYSTLQTLYISIPQGDKTFHICKSKIAYIEDTNMGLTIYFDGISGDKKNTENLAKFFISIETAEQKTQILKDLGVVAE